MRPLRTAVLAAVLVLLVACGVEPQPRAEPFSVAPPTSSAPTTEARGSADGVVYFLRGDRLHPVRRRLVSTRLDRLLQALAAGPTRGEVVDGVRTAVAPQYFAGARSDQSSQVAVVSATGQLASIAGHDQLLAVAQLVWTVTEARGVSRVRLEIEGRRVEVPTDAGLTGYPVGREHFASVAPTGSVTDP